jgi:hypothetical protein
VITNLISAVRELRNGFGSGFVLSMAPETFFVQVGFDAYGSSAGAYLPVIHGLRDILSYIHVQHYNTGSVTALDGRAYSSATADFHVAMAEMLLAGFPVAHNANNVFPALRRTRWPSACRPGRRRPAAASRPPPCAAGAQLRHQGPVLRRPVRAAQSGGLPRLPWPHDVVDQLGPLRELRSRHRTAAT